MKTADLARKLRARLAVLRKVRKAALATHDKAFEAWKADLGIWLKSVSAPRALKLSKTEVYSENRYGYRSEERPPASLFHQAPRPPEPPSDKALREVQKTLRFIALTGQRSIEVTPAKLETWFGDGGGEDD